MSAITLAASADVNNDGTVNVVDLVAIVQAIQQPYNANFDVNNDGHIDVRDLIVAVRSISSSGGPSITSVTTNLASYGGQVPMYDKLELTFNVNTVANNLNLPYDSSPPPGVQAGVGVSVDALFTKDNWQTTYTIPAFYYQDFLDEVRSGSDWLYPTNNKNWKVRFAPDATGSWQYRLRVRDSSGEFTTQASTFSVTTSNSKGFITVSADPRYFSFSDGTYFPGLGYNMNYAQISWDNPVTANQQNFQTMGQNGIQLIRMWLSQWSIYGSSWGPWNPQEPHLDLFWEMLDFHTAYPGSEVSLLLDATDVSTGAECMFWGWERKSPSVKRNTNYRVRVRFKSQGITGPRQAGKPYGFVVKTGGWLWDGGSNNCNNANTGTVHAATYSGGSWSVVPDTVSGWNILEGTINSGNKDYLDNLFLVLENANKGQVYIDNVWFEESLGSNQYGPNIISKPWMAHHLYFDQRQSFAFDKVVELAEDNGVYLRPVLLEKNEDIGNRLTPDGSFAEYDGSNNFFYGEGRQMTKGRWLQQAWWRYAQARWGYSTNIHSWELLNEGDPGNQRHYDLADEFGKYMHQFGPNSHLVSTSFWNSFPNSAFWANTNYPDIDFADVHQYIPSNDANYADMAANSLLLGSQIGSLTNGGPKKPVVRGETGIVDGGTDPPSGPVAADTQGTWLHNLVWVQLDSSGLMEPGYWYYFEHIAASNGAFDHRTVFKPYYDFVKDLPLTNARYVDAQATSSTAHLRVIGQKDIVGGKAHLWIQNTLHTWKNVVNGVSMTPRSGTITIAGFTPSTSYTVQWYNTQTGQVTSTQSITTNTQGLLSLTVNSLTTDIAVKISGSGTTPPPPPIYNSTLEGWPMAGANPERTSWVSEQGLKSGNVAWFKPFESYISQRTQIIATQDTLFVSTANGLYAIDPDTGNQKWVYATDMPLGNAPTVVGNTAYVGGTDKKLHAVNIATGTKVWTFNAGGGFLTNPLVINGVVYAGNRDGYMYAVDASTGLLRWKYKTGGEVLYSAAYKDGVIYFGANDMHAYALNANTGALVWKSAELPTGPFYSWWPVVNGDKVIFSGSSQYQIHPFGNIFQGTLQKMQVDDVYHNMARGTLVGPSTSAGGPWPSSSTVIDVSKSNSDGSKSSTPVSEFYEQKPYRRSLFVLDRATGIEKKYDFDGDGNPEYAPILYSGTHSGTRYPPMIDANGLVYVRTSYLSDQYIPGSGIAAWKMDTPYLSLPQKNNWFASDEPMAHSGAGDIIYWNLCCDRAGGWFDSTNPSSSGQYFQNSYTWGIALNEIIPNYRPYWNNPDDANLNGICGTPGSCFGTFGANGPYGWHANQNPPIPYKGKLFMHRGNTLIAISANGARTAKPAATIVPKTDSINIPTKTELQTLLDLEITKMINAGHLRPGNLGMGIAQGSGPCYADMSDYFHNPSDTIHTLMLALPQVSSGLQSNLRSYIQSEMNNIPGQYGDMSAYQIEHLGMKYGAKREKYTTPPDLASAISNLGSMDAVYPSYTGWKKNPFMFYAMWEYAKEFGGAKNLFDNSKNYLESPPSDTYLKDNPQVLNAYVAGYYGYLQLQSMAGYAQTSSVQSEYNRLLNLRITSFTKDSAYRNSQVQNPDGSLSLGKPYCRGFSASSNFLWMTPELATSLRSQKLSQVRAAVDEYEYSAPYWFVSNVDEGMAENAVSWLYDTNGIYTAKAWILQEPYTELARYIDTPGFERGDLFYIQKLVFALEAN